MSSFDPQSPEYLVDSEAAKQNEALYNQLQMSSEYDSSSSSSSSPYKEEKGGRASVSADGKNRPRYVTVGEAELRGGRFTSYHAYKITADPVVVDHVFRRFSDFVWLRESLHKLFPAIFLPPLPAKKLLGSKDDDTVNERRPDLERFLNRIARRLFLVDTEPFQLFLYKATLFEEAQKEFDKNVSKRDSEEIIASYKSIFPSLNNITLSSLVDTEMDSLREFLLNSENKMETLLMTSDKLSQSVNTYITDISKLNSALNSNYDGEKGYPDRPNPSRLDISEHFISWHLAEKDIGSAHEDFLVSTFKYELQDLQSYIEIVKVRYDVYAKYQSALKTSKSWEGKPVKNEKQEAQKQADQQKEQLEREHIEIVNKLVLHGQIHTYWKSKMAFFKKQIALFAAQQISTVKRLADTWEGLASLVKLDPVDDEADSGY